MGDVGKISSSTLHLNYRSKAPAAESLVHPGLMNARTNRCREPPPLYCSSFVLVGSTYTAVDPTNLKLEHSNSTLDIRQRFVLAFIYQPQTHFHGLMDKALGGWRFAPMIQMQTGLPYTPYVSGSASGLTVPDGTDGCNIVAGCAVNLAYKGLNGSGSSADRLPWMARDTYNYPKTAVVDARLGKNFFFDAPHFESLRLEFLAEVFNVMNHQNITGVNDEAYTLSGTSLTAYPSFGQFTNSNSNYAYSSRQVQIAARIHF